MRCRNFLSVIICFTLLARATAAASLSRRDIKDTCFEGEKCKMWYELSGPWCASGYNTQIYEYQGHPLGRYCERPCDSMEQKQCDLRLCKYATDSCTIHKTRPYCKSALQRCDGPVKTPESVCKSDQLQLVVKYDDISGMCSKEGAEEQSKYGPGNRNAVLKVTYYPLDFSEAPHDPEAPLDPEAFVRVEMTCRGLSSKGATDFVTSVPQGGHCHQLPAIITPHGAVGECSPSNKKVFDDIVREGKIKCAQAQRAFGHGEPEFESKKNLPVRPGGEGEESSDDSKE